MFGVCNTPGWADDASAPPQAKRIWFPRFSPKGTKLATAHGGWERDTPGAVRVWDVLTGREVQLLATPRGVRSVAWAANGTVIIAGTYGRGFHLFEVASGREIPKQTLDANVEGVLVSPDEKELITSLSNGTIVVWDLAQGTRLHEFKGAHASGIRGLAQSSDGRYLASAGQDKFVRVFDLVERKKLYDRPHPRAANGLVFSPDGSHLLTGCEDSLIRGFDVQSGTESGQLAGHQGGDGDGPAVHLRRETPRERRRRRHRAALGRRQSGRTRLGRHAAGS
jgi:WD40 repeat protein